MLSWALFFFIVAIIAAILGFGGLAASMAGIAKIIFYVAIALFLISMISRAIQGLTCNMVMPVYAAFSVSMARKSNWMPIFRHCRFPKNIN